MGFTSIKENNNSLIISPNPATNIIKTSGVKEKTQLCLYDMFGKIILTTETEINVELDVSNLSQGVYTLLSASKSNQTYNKFVIIRE